MVLRNYVGGGMHLIVYSAANSLLAKFSVRGYPDFISQKNSFSEWQENDKNENYSLIKSALLDK